MGGEVVGTLGTQDVLSANGHRVQVWTIELSAGEVVQVDLRSEAFDAFLYLMGPSLGAGLRDDNGGGGLNSRICFEVREAGEHRVVAASVDGSTGDFSMEVSWPPNEQCDAPDSGPDLPTRLESVEPDPSLSPMFAMAGVELVGELPLSGEVVSSFTGDEAHDALRESTQGWRLDAQAGRRFAITLVAPGFDPVLSFDGPRSDDWILGRSPVGGREKRICVEIPYEGTFGVFVTDSGEARPGAEYRVTVLDGAEAEAACDGLFHLSPASEVATLLNFDPAGRTIAPDEEAEGELLPEGPRHPLEGEPLQPWLLTGPGGSTVYIDVVSDEFGAKLRAVWPGLGQVLVNDVYGDGCNARLEIVIPDSGEILLLPGSLGETGRYLLRVATDPAELEGGGCESAETRGAR
jgi:hypothetical protein